LIRWAVASDYPALSDMLTAEGIPPDQQVHSKWGTWVCDNGYEVIGFYTLNIVNNRPAIQHLCVRRDSRNPKVIREMMHHLIQWCVDNKHDHIYIHADKDKPDVKRAIEYYFKVKPFYQTDTRWWYFLTIGGKR
jgi:hypothetical protein